MRKILKAVALLCEDPPHRGEALVLVDEAQELMSKGGGGSSSSGGSPGKADSSEQVEKTKNMLKRLDERGGLSDWAATFVESVGAGFSQYGSLTSRQYAKLVEIYEEEFGSEEDDVPESGGGDSFAGESDVPF